MADAEKKMPSATIRIARSLIALSYQFIFQC
jgi:hypothetical protein